MSLKLRRKSVGRTRRKVRLIALYVSILLKGRLLLVGNKLGIIVGNVLRLFVTLVGRILRG